MGSIDFFAARARKISTPSSADVRTRFEAAKTAGDERVTRSLQDSLADAELRLDNYRKAAKDAAFVAIELDRIETKIQALIEMGVSRQDPGLPEPSGYGGCREHAAHGGGGE